MQVPSWIGRRIDKARHDNGKAGPGRSSRRPSDSRWKQGNGAFQLADVIWALPPRIRNVPTIAAMASAPPPAGIKKAKQPRRRMTIDDYYQDIVALLDTATHIPAETRTHMQRLVDDLYNSILESRAREAELHEQFWQSEERLWRLREERRREKHEDGLCKCSGRAHRIEKGRRGMPRRLKCLCWA
jgi:hypothetical protein